MDNSSNLHCIIQCIKSKQSLSNLVKSCTVHEEKFIKFGQNGTVWKFQDYSVSHILREINFGESRSFKIAF